MQLTSALRSSEYWRDLLERIGRQAAQTALPIVMVVGVGQTVDIKAAVLAVLVAVVVTVLKALVGLKVDPGEALGWQLLDRAVPAAAGVVLGFVPVDATGLLTIDWTSVVVAALGAAVTAVLAYYVTPPSSVVAANATPDYNADNELL